MTPSQFELFMRRLIKMKTPKVVVMLVLLTSWLDMPVQNKAPFQVLEYYAGVARIATLAKHYAFKFAGKMVRVMDQAGMGSSESMELDSKTDEELYAELMRLEEYKAQQQKIEQQGVAPPVPTPVRSHQPPPVVSQPSPGMDELAGPVVSQPSPGMDGLAGPNEETQPGEIETPKIDACADEGSAFDSLTESQDMADVDLATGLAQCFGAGIPAPQHVPDEPVHGPAVDGDELMVDDDPYGFFEKAQVAEAAESEKQDPTGKNVSNVENLQLDAFDVPVKTKQVSSQGMKRIYRLMTPREDGSLLVPQAVLDKWKELFIQRCKRIVESIEEKDLWVDGKFMSEKAMTDDGMDAARILAVKAECKKHTGWIRRDLYEKNVRVYWVEDPLAGRRLKRKRTTLTAEEDADPQEVEDSMRDISALDDFDLPEEIEEAEVLLDADSKENQKSQMKAIAFPLMDDPDALPSSYITKVLTCVSKWSCKLQKLTEGVGPDVTPNASMDALSQKALAIDKVPGQSEDSLSQLPDEVQRSLEPVHAGSAIPEPHEGQAKERTRAK